MAKVTPASLASVLAILLSAPAHSEQAQATSYTLAKLFYLTCVNGDMSALTGYEHGRQVKVLTEPDLLDRPPHYTGGEVEVWVTLPINGAWTHWEIAQVTNPKEISCSTTFSGAQREEVWAAIKANTSHQNVSSTVRDFVHSDTILINEPGKSTTVTIGYTLDPTSNRFSLFATPVLH